MNVVSRLRARGGGLAFQTGAYSISGIVNRGASFLLIPVYTHLLTVAEYGLLVSLFFTVQVLLPIVKFGQPDGLVRFLPELEIKQHSGALLSISTILLLGLGVGILLALQPLRLPLAEIYQQDRGRTGQLLALVGALTAAHAWFVLMSSYYRARRLPAPFVLVSVIVAGLLLFGTVGGLTLIEASVEMVLIVHALAYGLLATAGSVWPFRREGFAWDRKLCTRLVAFCAPLSLADSGRVAIDLATLYSLGLFADPELVGVYALGLTLARI